MQVLSRDPISERIIDYYNKEIASKDISPSSDSDCAITSPLDNESAVFLSGLVKAFKGLKAVSFSSESVKPKLALKHLSCLNSSFKVGIQQDAPECLMLLMDKIFSQLSEPQLTFRGYSTAFQTCLVCGKQRVQDAEAFSNLVLPMPLERNLSDALNGYFEEEILDQENSVYCDDCAKKQPAARTSKILEAPDSLFLTLSRSEGDKKNCSEVSIPKKLNIASNAIKILPCHEERMSYVLEGAVLHHGSSTKSGHYTAIVREKKEWKIFDDDQAVKRKRQTFLDTKIVKRDAYILRYQKSQKPSFTLSKKNFLHTIETSTRRLEINEDEREKLTKIYSGPEDTIIFSDGVHICTKKDLKTLHEGKWLNERVINAYLKLAEVKAKLMNKKVLVLDSYFFDKWTRNKKAVITEIWNDKRNRFLIFDYEKVLVPIIQSNHWSLVVIDVKEKSLLQYDSLTGSTNTDIAKEIIEFLCYVHVATGQHQEMNVNDWTILDFAKTIPLQTNHFDCGVFVCKFGQYSALHTSIDFGQVDMSYFRKEIAIEISEGNLL